MENLHFLSKISNLLISEIDTKELADGINSFCSRLYLSKDFKFMCLIT